MYLIFWTAFDYVGAFDFEQCTHQSMIQVQSLTNVHQIHKIVFSWPIVLACLGARGTNSQNFDRRQCANEAKGLNTGTLLEPFVSGVELVVNYLLNIVTSCFFRQELHLIFSPSAVFLPKKLWSKWKLKRPAARSRNWRSLWASRSRRCADHIPKSEKSKKEIPKKHQKIWLCKAWSSLQHSLTTRFGRWTFMWFCYFTRVGHWTINIQQHHFVGRFTWQKLRGGIIIFG